MNIEIWKKYLVGKTIAFSSFGTIDAKYRGVISDAIQKTEGMNPLVLFATQANFHSVSTFVLAGSIMHTVQETEGQSTCPFCEEPVLDGCVRLGDLVTKVILPAEKKASEPPEPPKLPGVKELIGKTGTFTGCKELTDKFVSDGLIRKDGRTLYVNMDIASQPGCMCGLAYSVEAIEALTRDLKKFFDADEIVYHNVHRPVERASVIEVEAGYTGMIDRLPGAYKDDHWCGTYPVIKGLGMRWEFRGDPITK